MTDLFSLCADMKKRRSHFRQSSVLIISDIYSYLCHPSSETAEIIGGWKDDFQYIYGNVSATLSGNSRLNGEKLLSNYGITLDDDDCTEALQLLIFAIQTYFSILIKYILCGILGSLRSGRTFSHEDIITGGFAEEYGIENFRCEDRYCWPLFELRNGFSAIAENIRLSVGEYRSEMPLDDFMLNNNHDLIKQIYEAMIPKELRHALGEYYTPDWLAESVIKSAFGASGIDDIRSASVIDPTCGSGTFLVKAIALKRKNGCTLSEILETVRGVDINPLAVLTAKTNYILSVLDMIRSASAPVSIPVYNADVISLASSGGEDGTRDPAAVIGNSPAEDRMIVSRLDKADIVVGNPPWVNWEYMPEKYRLSSQHCWTDYGLFSAKGRKLSFAKEDISILITCIVIDRLLKNGGVIGFVIRQSAFKSAQNGAGFRNFRVCDTEIKVIKVEDLSRLHVFENAMTSTALFFARKGEDNTYPVPYYLWEKRADLKRCTFGAYSPLREVMSQITITAQRAMPAVKDDITSIWITAREDRLESLSKVLGTNGYRARTGVFTGGANAVYWLRINGSSGDRVNVTNLIERAKRKTEQITTDIEKTYIYPMLKGCNIGRWQTGYDTYLLCPHTAETKIRPVPKEILADTSPLTMRYLWRFREDLDGRNGFAGWEKERQRQEFHSVLRVGGYTFSTYKVVWKYIASAFICAVISSVDDEYLGNKPLLPNEKVMYVSTDDEEEAYYLCGLLSSTPVAECVKSYMNPTSISAHVLNKLNIPAYDREDPIHRQIAESCREGHGKRDILPYIRKIDALAEELYGIRPEGQ